MEIKKLSPSEWALYSKDAHAVCFSEHMPTGLERITFALLAVENGEPCAYMTCRENDAETIYWQYGGSFPGTKDTTKSFRAYQAFTRWHKERYKRAVTYIENDNFVMLKMAMKIGFKIQGLRYFKNSVLLEHLLEF